MQLSMLVVLHTLMHIIFNYMLFFSYMGINIVTFKVFVTVKYKGRQVKVSFTSRRKLIGIDSYNVEQEL